MTPEELIKKREEEAKERGEVAGAAGAAPTQIIVDMRGPQVRLDGLVRCSVVWLCTMSDEGEMIF